MKNKRVIAALIASVLTTQSLSIAQAKDRTTDIGENQIAQARANLSLLTNQLNNLDRALVSARAGILQDADPENRETWAPEVASVALTTTAAALAFGFIKGRKIGYTSEVGRYQDIFLVSLLPWFSSLFSAFSGVDNGCCNEKDLRSQNLQELRSAIHEAKKVSSTFASTNSDSLTKQKIESILSHLDVLEKESYTVEDNLSGEKKKILFASAALVFGAMTMMLFPEVFSDSNSSGRKANVILLLTGAAIMTAGNLMQKNARLTKEEAHLMLKELDQLRLQIQSVKLSLK